MLFIQLLTILIIFLFLVHLYQRRRRNAVANIPGPFALPVLGCVQRFTEFHPESMMMLLEKYRKEFGTISRGWAFNRMLVASCDLELNEQLLTSQQHIVKHRHYKILKPWLGTGLLISHGKKWFSRRKIITPTFHFKILEQFVEIFDQQSKVFVNKLEEKAIEGNNFDVFPYVCLVTLDIIAETAMGTKIYAQTDKSNQYAKALHELTEIISLRLLKLHMHNEILFSLTNPRLKIRQDKLITILHNFTMNVIEERRKIVKEKLQTNDINTEIDEDIGVKKRMAFLDVLLQSTAEGKALTNDDIREEVDTFMFEGHDTTTSAICFALYLIARHSQVQQKLYKEIVEVLGKNIDKPINLHDLNNLNYMECVIKESLRLYPSVAIIGREILEDFEYTHSKLGKGIIPAGSEFIIPIYNMLREPSLYKNPTDFIPERHQNTETQNPFSFIPFSAGPRNCIGQKFAMYEMKTILARTIQCYELLPLGKEVNVVFNIVLRSLTGFQLGLKKRSVLY